ncbi:hypothetical protein BKA70DRAFT_1377644 [Coprinopsis sp. MPI-PUGE-AT-0042]|nr:hypothetical protein BKA70DRAFT_1377644 [Coprinopsis sp. MPI-PUGE-AT-0042]
MQNTAFLRLRLFNVGGSVNAPPCDVRLEPFGRESKMPCSISCGYVFCVECLDNICPPMRPLCRKSFNPHLTVRLHIGLDSVKVPPSPQGSPKPTNDEEDAKRIYTAITKIATKGCSESHIRGVISEGKTFLNGKPHDSFKDLRTVFPLMSYLAEVKSNLRSTRQKNQDLAQQHEALMEEQESLLVEVKPLVKKREQGQKQALDIELNLRKHCSKANEAYERMVE